MWKTVENPDGVGHLLSTPHVYNPLKTNRFTHSPALLRQAQAVSITARSRRCALRKHPENHTKGSRPYHKAAEPVASMRQQLSAGTARLNAAAVVSRHCPPAR